MSDENQEVNQTPDNTPQVNPEVEQEARRFGWVPKDEFKGNEEQWRDADEFLKRGREINGYLRNDLEKLDRQNKTLVNEITELKDTMQEFKKFHDETEKRAYERALAQLKQQKKEALADGDHDQVVEIDDQIQELKAIQPKPADKKQEQKPALTREDFDSWTRDNAWYLKDPALRAAADGFVPMLKNNPQYRGLVGREFLEEISKAVKGSFPEKFQNSSRRNPSPVEGDLGTPRSTSGKKSYADLPEDAKLACDKFVKQKLLTKEQYVSEYFGE